jgi:pimeloyl-ACP methyl ester carboxylesterase
MKKAFVCIHGFGHHHGGRRHGFSSALCENVAQVLEEEPVWEEVLWDDLLESPPTDSLVEFVRRTPEIVRKFYRGRCGRPIRERVAEMVRVASKKANGAPIVLVGHSFGGAIAYDVLARRQAPEVKALVMLAPPMGLFNHPEEFVRSAAGHGVAGALAAIGLDKMAAHIVGFPKVRGGRLGDDIAVALSIRSDSDWFAVSLAPEFHDVSEITAKPPRGTRGSANHRFYWRSPEVAEDVAGAAVLANLNAGAEPTTKRELDLQVRTAMNSLYTPPRYGDGFAEIS